MMIASIFTYLFCIGVVFSQDLSTVRYLLWTRANPDVYYNLLVNDEGSLADSNFDGSKRTHFAYHGWTQRGESDFIIAAKDAFLLLEDINFISVDYEELGGHPSYEPSVRAMYDVANLTAGFIEFLTQQTPLETSNIHAWGHSLGGQASGMTGHYVIDLGLPPIDRATALDPAGPSFEDEIPSRRIDRTCANFVDIIHTNAGLTVLGYLGLYDAVGHVDFYPNGGQNQAGCDGNGSCSHARSNDFWVESISSSVPFTSEECASYDDYLINNCTGRTAEMGYYATSEASGTHYLNTNPEPPFAQG